MAYTPTVSKTIIANNSSFERKLPPTSGDFNATQGNPIKSKKAEFNVLNESWRLGHWLCIVLEFFLLGYLVTHSIENPTLQYCLVGLIPCMAVALMATHAKPRHFLTMLLHSALLSVIASLPAILNPQDYGNWMIFYLVLPALLLYKSVPIIMLAGGILSFQWLWKSIPNQSITYIQPDQYFIWILSLQTCIMFLVTIVLKHEARQLDCIQNLIEQLPNQQKNLALGDKLSNHLHYMKQLIASVFMINQDHQQLKEQLLQSKIEIQDQKDRTAVSVQELNDFIQGLMRETRIAESTSEICDQLKQDCFDILQQIGLLLKHAQQLQTGRMVSNTHHSILHDSTDMISNLAHQIKQGIDAFEGHIIRINRATHHWVENGQMNQRNAIDVLSRIEQNLHECEITQTGITTSLHKLENIHALLKSIDVHLSHWPIQPNMAVSK